MNRWQENFDHYKSEHILGAELEEWAEKYEGRFEEDPREILLISIGYTGKETKADMERIQTNEKNILNIIKNCLNKGASMDAAKSAVAELSAGQRLYIAEGDEEAKHILQRACGSSKFNDSDWGTEHTPRGIITIYSQWYFGE